MLGRGSDTHRATSHLRCSHRPRPTVALAAVALGWVVAPLRFCCTDADASACAPHSTDGAAVSGQMTRGHHFVQRLVARNVLGARSHAGEALHTPTLRCLRLGLSPALPPLLQLLCGASTVQTPPSLRHRHVGRHQGRRRVAAGGGAACWCLATTQSCSCVGHGHLVGDETGVAHRTRAIVLVRTIPAEGLCRLVGSHLPLVAECLLALRLASTTTGLAFRMATAWYVSTLLAAS